MFSCGLGILRKGRMTANIRGGINGKLPLVGRPSGWIDSVECLDVEQTKRIVHDKNQWQGYYKDDNHG